MIAADPLALQALAAAAPPMADDLRRAAQRVEAALGGWNRSTARGFRVDLGASTAGLRAVATGVEKLDGWVGQIGAAFARADATGIDVRALLAQVPLLADDAGLMAAAARSVLLLEQGSAQLLDRGELATWPIDVLSRVGIDPTLPVATRDRVNRALLTALLANDDAGGSGMLQPRDRAAMRGLLAVTLTSAGHRVQLLRVRGPARSMDEPEIVVVVGDLRAATSVAYWMPGTTHGVHSWSAELGTADDLISASDRAAASAGIGPQTAVVVDLYDAPDTLTAAARPGYGNRHAQHTVENIQDVGMLAGDARVTVIGHSYGSFAAGRAAQAGVDANAIVLLASPGTGAKSAVDLQPLRVDLNVCSSTDGVFVARAPMDPIMLPADADEFFSGVGGTAPLPRGLARAAGAKMSLGTDPADASFGAKVFEVNDVGTAPGDPDWVFDHSNYLLEGSRSLDNIARIVAGLAPTIPSPHDLAARESRVDPPGPGFTDGFVMRRSRGWWLGTDGTAASR